MTDRGLAEAITKGAADLEAALCAWLGLVAEFDRRSIWAAEGAKSCAQWLAWFCSISPVTAREHVRVARRLEELPAIRAAFAVGTLSFSKVRALCRIEDIELEQELLELAQEATAAQLERLVSGYRGVVATELGAAKAREARSFSAYYDDDGALVIRGKLPAEEGALVLAALDAAYDALADDRRQMPPQPGDDEAHAPVTQADVLLHLIDRSMMPAEGKRRTFGDKYQVVVHVDADLLPTDGDQGVGALTNGVALPPKTIQRLCCDCSVVTMAERDGNVLSVGRKTRRIPPSLRRALDRRDPCCRFPGCEQRRNLDGHHLEYWTDGGETALTNLANFCGFHHTLLHEGGFRAERRADGELVFFRPNGSRLRPVPRPRRGEPLAVGRRNRERGVSVTPGSIVPRSLGQRLDVGYGVDALLRFAPPGGVKPAPAPQPRQRFSVDDRPPRDEDPLGLWRPG